MYVHKMYVCMLPIIDITLLCCIIRIITKRGFLLLKNDFFSKKKIGQFFLVNFLVQRKMNDFFQLQLNIKMG